MKRISLASALAALAIAIVPATAAAGPKWEFAASSGPYSVLPPGSSEALRYVGSFSFNAAVAGASQYNFKDVCSVAGEMTVFNPLTPNKGEDENTSFFVSCPANGTPPEPCKNAESFILRQTTPVWPSKLTVGIYDDLGKVEMEIECEHGATESVVAAGGAWKTKVAVNSFSFATNYGSFEVLNTEFIMWGKVKVTPAKWARVR